MIDCAHTAVYKSIPFSIKKADTFLLRLKGLMFRKKPIQQEGVWIIPCNSIHMCFMYFPIDAVFLDKNMKIVKLAYNVQPWTFIPPVTHAHSVLELPNGTVQELDLQIGHCIKI